MPPTLTKGLSARSKGRKRLRVGILSLGCPKTLVDSEVILGKLDPAAYRFVPSVTDCDIALLNTCSFIRDAQQESLQRIFELLELKRTGAIKRLVVMGCLVQEFPGDLRAQLEEVDAFVGSGEYAKIPSVLQRVSGGEKVFSLGVPGYLATSAEGRVALTPAHYRYLKISEGCDHACSFCTIPSFRGRHRSRSLEDVVREACDLTARGAKELILTGQDTTYFGRDHTGRFLLPELLRRLDRIEGIHWVRLLYAYPACVTDELIDAIQEGKRICHYLDMPLQHASDRMLLAMHRGITKRRTYDLLRRFREAIPDLAIRTTMITGFPGETEEDFEELLAFMKEMRFERLGLFTYSREEGSPAARLGGQIPEEIKQHRWERAMRLQQEISRGNNQALLGRSLEVLIEEQDEKDRSVWKGRTYMDAPEVDGNVFVTSAKRLQIGGFYPVKITSTRDYDLVGEL